MEIKPYWLLYSRQICFKFFIFSIQNKKSIFGFINCIIITFFLQNHLRKAMSKTIKIVSIIFCLSFLTTGCSTLSSGYDSISTTVGDWFKSDEAKK